MKRSQHTGLEPKLNELFRPLNVVLLVLVALLAVCGVLLIPEAKELPVRWGLDGSVAATLPRNWALLQMPIATAIVWALIYAVGRVGNAQRRAGAERTLRLIVPVLTALFALVQLIVVLLGAGVSLPFFHAY